ncbi:retrovirus-related Pol polyprotein from transposon 17.6 [Trichonephila clavipes]|nr:retrovirus-related Pol polyprotein from transposon 17.6 [Trichonephila clavipes]
MGVISSIGGYNFGCFNSLAIEHNELSSVSVDISHKRDKRRLAQNSPESYRFAIDYRKLNGITKYPRYPLPVIDDLLTNIPHTNVMSTLDHRSGYFQLAISPRDIEKTTFITRNGTFAFLRMPFGLSGAAPYFQRAIDVILKPVIGRFVLVYMDDVIITSPSFKDHLDHLFQFNLFTDASGVGIGAVLQQKSKTYCFRVSNLNKAERNYTVTERECLAVIWAQISLKLIWTPTCESNHRSRSVNKVNQCAADRKQVGKFMPKFEGPHRVLELNGNNLIVWKSGEE